MCALCVVEAVNLWRVYTDCTSIQEISSSVGIQGFRVLDNISCLGNLLKTLELGVTILGCSNFDFQVAK